MVSEPEKWMCGRSTRQRQRVNGKGAVIRDTKQGEDASLRDCNGELTQKQVP